MVKTGSRNRGKLAVGASLALGAGVLGLTSLFAPAFAAKIDATLSQAPIVFFEQFTPAGVDSRLAEKFEERNSAISSSNFPFTPAGASQQGRTLTVAARSQRSSSGSNAISVRNSITAVEAGQGKNRLKKIEFRLTSAKGWQGFNLVPDRRAAVKAPLITDLGKSSFRLDKGPKNKPSRFQPDIAVDKDRSATPAARGNAAPDDYKLDVGGSFRISKKVDVTAGVRYKSERDRIAPVSDDRQDSEAVYIGTKIRF